MSTWIWRLHHAVNVILNLSIDRGMLVYYLQGIFPIKWTVFFMNQSKIIKSISSAPHYNLHDLHIRGWKRNHESWIIVTKLVRIVNLCTWARESWKTRVWEKLNKIDVWINCVRSNECRTWHLRESRKFKYFSGGTCPWAPYNSCIRDWQSARFSSNISA